MSHAFNILIAQQARAAALESGKVTYAFQPLTGTEADNADYARARLAELVAQIRMTPVGEATVESKDGYLNATQAVTS